VRALSIYGVALGLAAVGGQVVGGGLLTLDVAGLGWRLCFLINVPIGVAAWVLTPRLVPADRGGRAAGLDLTGTALLGAALVAVLLPLINGRQSGWPAWTWVSLGLAPLLAAGFVAHQRRVKRGGGEPLVDLHLFRDRAVSAGLLTQLALAGAQASFFVYLAVYLQDGRGLSPLGSGLTFAAVAATYVAVSGRATALAQRRGRAVIRAGGLTLVAGFLMLAATIELAGSGASVAVLVPGLALAGAGIGLGYTPLTSIVLAGVAPARAGAAAGAMSTTQQVGYAVGVAVTGTIFFAGGDLASAFAWSLVQLAACGAAVAYLARLLPLEVGV
jgi:predicted MFS family arabinose efflux permease